MQQKEGCQEMDSTFFRCRKEDSYQKRLVVLLTVVQDRPEVPSVAVIDLLAITENLSQAYFASNWAYSRLSSISRRRFESGKICFLAGRMSNVSVCARLIGQAATVFS